MTTVEGHARDLLVLLDVADRPVRVEEAAVALGLDESAVLALAEDLLASGHVAEAEQGLVAAGQVPSSASRRSVLAGRWADTLRRLAADPVEVGMANSRAGRHREAFELLSPVAAAGAELQVVEAALRSAGAIRDVDPEMEGRLRLARAIHLRDRGLSEEARGDLEVAIRRLKGEELVDALGFAAAIADDLQRPQESETLAALAAMEAADGHHAKLGSLLTLQARSLNRIGFPIEANRAIEVGTALVAEHGTPRQVHNARLNQAWVWLDRGDARRAEPAFAHLRGEAADMDPVSLANQEAYWARALFVAGDPAAAVAALRRAEGIAEREKADAPRFLAALAAAEGAWLYGRHVDGVEAAERTMAVAAAAMPAWANVAHYWLARNLAGLGRWEEARDECSAAIEACPPGVDGWRWRSRAQALAMILGADLGDWPQADAEELTDQLLQARLFDVAADLMAVRAEREADPELGTQAVGLALKLGNPMLAALAAEEAGLWSDEVGVGVARAVRPVVERWPAEWEGRDSYLPLAHALAVDVSGEPVAPEHLERRIDEALATAGLTGTDIVLSPAQRRGQGLVRRRPLRRRVAGGAALALGVAAISAVTALAVLATRPEEQLPSSTTAAPATTTTLALEETPVPVPEDLSGSAPYRGGNARDGVAQGGVDEPAGRYWVAQPGGFLATDPVAYGRLVYVGSSTEDAVFALSNRDGSVLFQVGTRGRVASAPTVGQLAETTYLVFGSDDGRVYARDALRGGLSTLWEVDVGGAVRGSPVMAGDLVVVGTDAGRVVALSPVDGGREVWSYSGTADRPLAPVETSLAESAGVVYAADAEGRLHLLDLAGGEPLCEPFEAFGPVVGNPIVSEGAVYLATSIGTVHLLPEGSCTGVPQGKVGTIQSSVAFQVPPAVAGGVLYALEEQRLLAYDTLDGQLSVWPVPYDAGERIVTAPVVTEDSVYVGTQAGTLIAVDRETGEERWRFATDSPIGGSPALIPGAVFVATEDGRVIAIGGEGPGA